MSSRRLSTGRIAGLLFLCCLAIAGLPLQAQEISRPGIDQGPTVMEARIVLLDVEEISSARQLFTANIFYMFTWQDERLVHEGPGARWLGMDQAWTPSIQLVNQQRTVRTFPERLLVTPEGEVSYRQRVWGTFSQKLGLRDFPFDTQRFSLPLVLATTDGHLGGIELIQDREYPSGMAEHFSLPDWEILDWEAESIDYAPMGGSESRPAFVFSFTARRYAGYYALKFMLPLLLIVCMSWIVFWVDPKEMGSQISVSVTSMLTLIAYRFMVGNSLPAVNYLTRMDEFILAATLLVFATLIEAVITGTLARKGRVQLALKIDGYARVLFPTATVGLSLMTLLA